MCPSNKITISEEHCTGCGWCIASCAQHAITLNTTLPNGFGDKRAAINPQLCNNCKKCIATCPHRAIGSAPLDEQPLSIDSFASPS